MARLNKEEQFRREGMNYALRIAKRDGIDALEQEIKFRNITELPCAISKKQCEELTENAKQNCIETIRVLACMVLLDEFDFGNAEIERFLARFNKKAECLADDYSTWKDQLEILADEVGVHLSINLQKAEYSVSKEE